MVLLCTPIHHSSLVQMRHSVHSLRFLLDWWHSLIQPHTVTFKTLHGRKTAACISVQKRQTLQAAQCRWHIPVPGPHSHWLLLIERPHRIPTLITHTKRSHQTLTQDSCTDHSHRPLAQNTRALCTARRTVAQNTHTKHACIVHCTQECGASEPPLQVLRPPCCEPGLQPRENRQFSVKHAMQQASLIGALLHSSLVSALPWLRLRPLGSNIVTSMQQVSLIDALLHSSLVCTMRAKGARQIKKS